MYGVLNGMNGQGDALNSTFFWFVGPDRRNMISKTDWKWFTDLKPIKTSTSLLLLSCCHCCWCFYYFYFCCSNSFTAIAFDCCYCHYYYCWYYYYYYYYYYTTTTTTLTTTTNTTSDEDNEACKICRVFEELSNYLNVSGPGERCMEFNLWNMNVKVIQLVIGATSNWPVAAHYNDVGWPTGTMRLRSAPRIINI